MSSCGFKNEMDKRKYDNIWQKFKPNQINFLLNTQQSANLFNFYIQL